MEERREYKDSPVLAAGLPREVYYRCIWLVRDMDRLRAISELRYRPDSGEHDVIVSEAVMNRACEDIEHIEKALCSIPEVYRTGVKDNIVSGTQFSDLAHPNTWKKWKRIFIFELAKELELI